MGILVEEFSGPRALDYFQTALRLEDERSGWTELVVLDPERAGEPRLGTRRLYNALGQLVANWPAPNSRGEIPLNSEIEPLESRPKPAVERGCARLPRLPRIRLVIVGAGHVGQAVATLASQVDFDVWVVDDRSDYANPTRFPTAEQCLVGPLDQILPALELTPQSFALVMTRGHGHDQEALGHLAQTAASYVGLIGSHRKIRMILDALRESGIEECALRRVVAPLGLDIGSQTVPEIAISIVAELVSWRNLGPRPKPSLLPERSRRASQPT
jgi:xanthine dehydrogenase accessory factor